MDLCRQNCKDVNWFHASGSCLVKNQIASHMPPMSDFAIFRQCWGANCFCHIGWAFQPEPDRASDATTATAEDGDRVDHHSKLCRLGRVEGVSERTSQFYSLESSYDFFVVFWWFWSKFSPLMPGLDNMKSVDKLSLCTHKKNCSWLYLAPTSTSNTLKQQWQVHLFIGLFVYQSFLADRIIN